MAVKSSFKQQCPSCEAMISVKENMIGKKVECTKCKDKFIAEAPDDEDDKPAKKKAKAESSNAITSKTPAAGKRPKLDVVDKVDDDLEVIDERPSKDKNKSKNKSRKDLDDDEADEKVRKNKKDDDDEKTPKKKNDKINANKLTIGLGLAIVGVIILCVAAFFLLRGGNRGVENGTPIVQKPLPPVVDEKKPEKKAEPAKKDDTNPIETGPLPLDDVERAKLTNLLPPDSEYIGHVLYDMLFQVNGPLRDVVFQKPGTLEDGELKKQLGFSLLAIDDILCAEKYTSPGWRYTVLHFTEVLKEDELKRALRLKPVTPIEGLAYYQLPATHPWLDQLGRFSFGVPNQIRQFDARTLAKPTFVRLHNPQTLVIADAMPMEQFLKAKGEFPRQNTEPAPAAPAATAAPRWGNRKQTFVSTNVEFVHAQPDPEGGGREEPYLTIKPSLKKIIDRMEGRGPDVKEKLEGKVLVSSVTDMDANIVTTSAPEFKDLIVRRPRQFWDATLLLSERKPRVRQLGTSLISRDTLRYLLKNEIICAQEIDAGEFHDELVGRGANTVARIIKRFLNHDVNTPGAIEKKPGDPENKPGEPRPAATTSEIRVQKNFGTVEFILDLSLDGAALDTMRGLATLMSSTLRVDLEAGAHLSPRHTLAHAGREFSEKGLSERELPSQAFPPGVFRRADAPFRADREPKNRISWMAGLLPYLGHENLFGRIKFDQSWRHESNLLAGNTLVPQFLDPSYPYHTRHVAVDGLNVDFAATHYVGIAGVGLDAAYYKRGDPLTDKKRGVFGYEESASLKEIIAGRGLSNTIMMIQVPHDPRDNLTSVYPWMAGGGATIRGVPEKDSIQPFVLNKDRNGNVIRHKNKNGTFVLMTDGSVRFVDENVSDDVFKAMCTIQGPNPIGYNLQGDPHTPLVPRPDPAAEAPVETPKVDPKKKTP